MSTTCYTSGISFVIGDLSELEPSNYIIPQTPLYSPDRGSVFLRMGQAQIQLSGKPEDLAELGRIITEQAGQLRVKLEQRATVALPTT